MCRRSVRGLPLAAALVVFSSVATKAQEISLEGIVVTTSKVEESAIDALSGSSSIGKEQLDEQFQADSTTQILNTIPGVTTSVNGHDTAEAVNVRGLQDFGRVNVLIDGARQNFQRSGHNANGVYYIEPEMLAGVEVTRGPTSTIYGSGAIGGVVSFNLLSADDILREGEYAAVRSVSRYATNGEGKLESGTAAARSGGFDILAQANGRWSNDYDDGNGDEVSNTGETTKSYLLKSRWRPAEGQEITATFIDLNSDFTDELGSAQRDTEVANNQYSLGYTYAKPDNPLLDFSAKIYRVETGLDQVRIDSSSIFEPAGSERSFDVVTEGFDVFNTSRFDFASTKVAFTYGADGFQDEVATMDPVGNGDEFTPGGERNVFGSFLQSQITFAEMVELIAAVRYDSYEIEGGTTHLEGDRVSPKVTLGVTPIQGMTFYATYAEGYRAPSVTETLISGVHPQPAPFPLLPNPDLEPEVAHNVEGGVNLKYDGVLQGNDAFRAKIVGFQNKVDNFIDQVAVFDPNSPLFFDLQYQNVAKATIEGVELEGTYDARSWFLSVAATHIRGTNEETGEGLYSIQPDRITVTTGIRALDEKLVAGVRGHFVDAQHRIPTQTLTLYEGSSGYSVFDFFSYYNVNENVALTLDVDNMFDRNYRQYLNQSNDPGLNARVGLTMRLGAQ